MERTIIQFVCLSPPAHTFLAVGRGSYDRLKLSENVVYFGEGRKGPVPLKINLEGELNLNHGIRSRIGYIPQQRKVC
jgi:hypothetical protein